MRTKIALLGLLLTSSLFATEVIFDDYAVNLTKQGGGSWATPLNLQIGVFQGGFTPSASNLSSWGTNFVSVGAPGYYDPSGPEWSTSLVLPSNTADFAVNAPLFVWAFDSKTVNGTSQWLLLSDSSWTLGTMSATLPTQDLNLSASSAALFGSFDYSNLTASTFATAVPEPATYAAILGLVTLGLVGYRRFRRS